MNYILLHYFTTWINPLYSHIKVRTMQLWCDGNYIGLLLYRCILLLTFWFKTNLERRPGRSGGNFTSSFGLVERCCARLLEMEWDDRYIFLNNLGIPFFSSFFYARGIKKSVISLVVIGYAKKSVNIFYHRRSIFQQFMNFICIEQKIKVFNDFFVCWSPIYNKQTYLGLIHFCKRGFENYWIRNKKYYFSNNSLLSE